MRVLRRVVPGCSLLLALGAAPRSSSAQLLIVAAEGGPSAIAHAELAYAVGDGPPVTWLALRFSGGPVAIVAALPKSAHAEPGLDAWFAALEKVGSPNVLPPRGAVACVERPGYVRVEWPRGAGAPGSELDLQTTEDVATALEEQGLPVPDDLPEAEHYAVWSWASPDTDVTTRTLRIVGASAPLELRPGPVLPVLVSGITRGPELRSNELPNDELSITFLRGPNSDYREQLRGWFAGQHAALLEARSRGALFDWSILSDLVSLPPLADGYARAASRELALDADVCARQLGQLEHAAAPSLAECGEAHDFELALSAVGGERATLQRWAVSGATGFAPGQSRAGGEPRLPLLRAPAYDGSGCVDDAPPPLSIEPPRTAPGRQGAPVVVEDTVVVETTTTSDASCGTSPGRDPYYDDRDTSCSSDTSSSSRDDDACSGDSSSSSSNDDTCSGDSSSSSSNDDACSGDSSSSSSTESGCASDSSSSSDTGCGGGSEESSYDGDTCTGSAAPGSQRSQKLAAARPRRVKTSLWALAFVAMALPIRRRKRRKI